MFSCFKIYSVFFPAPIPIRVSFYRDYLLIVPKIDKADMDDHVIYLFHLPVSAGVTSSAASKSLLPGTDQDIAFLPTFYRIRFNNVFLRLKRRAPELGASF